MSNPFSKSDTKPKLPRQKRARTPTLLQMEAVECGAAALGIILGYHGRIIPLEELRLACGVSRDGSKASNMVKAARSYGMTAKGYRRENPDSLVEFATPFIVFWNFNHFLVVEGFKKDKVFLNDPASGPRIVTRDEFNQSFTGVVLIFTPGPEFKKGGSKPSMIRALKRRISGSGLALTFVILASLALVIPGLVIPVFSRAFIDNVLIQKMDHWLKPLLIGMAITAVLRAILTWIQQYYLDRLETKIALSTSSSFFLHILRLPSEFFTQRFGGEIGGRVAINDKVANVISEQLTTTVLNVVMIVFYAALMFQYDVLLTSIGIVMVVINILVMKFVSRMRVDRSRKMLVEGGKLVGVSMTGLQSIETLKAMSGESDFFSRWAGHQTKLVNSQQEMGRLTLPLTVVPSTLEAVNTALLLGLGGWRIMEGHLTIGMLVAFQSLMGSFIGPVGDLVNMGGTVQELEGDMARLDDVLSYKTDEDLVTDGEEQAQPIVEVKLQGHLELRNITFGYSRLEKPLIEDFSLKLKPGSRVALVGPSGCGKSTISRMVAGLYRPWSGDILFDDRPRQEYTREVVSNSLAFVDQDIFLFEGKVRDNLAMWDKTIGEQNLVQAAKDASIHDDIATRTGGYDSSVEEGGANFSGGQRQRMEIARALVTFPTILVLDEATSALDAKTEKDIDDNLRKRGCTCLIVAHRLSTIRDCDEIVVLERGKVVQRGTHEELRNIEGHYAQLIKET